MRKVVHDKPLQPREDLRGGMCQEKAVGQVRIKGIRSVGKADVYNMEVEDTHDFVIQGGVISHNCADEVRYMCMANPMKPVQVKERAPKVYDPLSSDEDSVDRYAFYRKY